MARPPRQPGAAGRQLPTACERPQTCAASSGVQQPGESCSPWRAPEITLAGTRSRYASVPQCSGVGGERQGLEGARALSRSWHGCRGACGGRARRVRGAEVAIDDLLLRWLAPAGCVSVGQSTEGVGGDWGGVCSGANEVGSREVAACQVAGGGSPPPPCWRGMGRVGPVGVDQLHHPAAVCHACVRGCCCSEGVLL